MKNYSILTCKIIKKMLQAFLRPGREKAICQSESFLLTICKFVNDDSLDKILPEEKDAKNPEQYEKFFFRTKLREKLLMHLCEKKDMAITSGKFFTDNFDLDKKYANGLLKIWEKRKKGILSTLKYDNERKLLLIVALYTFMNHFEDFWENISPSESNVLYAEILEVPVTKATEITNRMHKKNLLSVNPENGLLYLSYEAGLEIKRLGSLPESIFSSDLECFNCNIKKLDNKEHSVFAFNGKKKSGVSTFVLNLLEKNNFSTWGASDMKEAAEILSELEYFQTSEAEQCAIWIDDYAPESFLTEETEGEYLEFSVMHKLLSTNSILVLSGHWEESEIWNKQIHSHTVSFSETGVDVKFDNLLTPRLQAITQKFFLEHPELNSQQKAEYIDTLFDIYISLNLDDDKLATKRVSDLETLFISVQERSTKSEEKKSNSLYTIFKQKEEEFLIYPKALETQLFEVETCLKNFDGYINYTQKKSLIVLLAGESGTGKTAFAKNLSAKLDTNLVFVNCFSLHDKYAGETEKHLVKIFDDYKKLRQRSQHIPILVFNEADSILSKKFTVDTANDLFANSIQNALLEIFESFEGSLILTTNNFEFEKAFNRRIDYKLYFKNENDSAYTKALTDHYLPELDEEEVEEITKFNPSPAELKLIAERLKMNRFVKDNDKIPHKEEYQYLRRIMASLRFENLEEKRTIGF